MAYVYDYINNTLIDDEDKSLGNKLGLMDGGRIELDNGGDAFRLKALQADYDKFGKKKLDKAARVLGFKDYASMSGQENNNFRRKIKNELTKYGEVLPRYEADVRGRRTRIPKEQVIQIKLLEETNNKKFFDPKKFAKENKISMDVLKKQAALLQKNIYNKRMKVAGKDMRFQLDWIPDNPTFSDNTLNKLWKSKLIKYDKNKIDELFYQAFGNPKSNTYQPKKFLAIKKNLNEYRQLRDAINKRYPKINFELDHPLSKSTLNNIFNATTDQLTRVNILEADLNNGFKDSLSLQYEKAIKDKNLIKKKAVEKIAKDLKLNIGKVSDNATNFKYGVKEFQKLNIRDEMSKAIRNQADLSSNFKNYVKKNPEIFTKAGVNPNVNITNIGKRELKGIDKILKSAKKVLKPVGKVVKPIGYAMGPYAVASASAKAEDMGIELNLIDKIKAFDSGDADVAIDSWKRRNDPEYAAEQRAKDLAQMSDDFEEVGLDEVKPDETIQQFMAHGGRAGFSNGGAAGADVDFATELEYFFMNPDTEIPEITTYKETNNPIEIFNDIIDPRNYPYYADILVRSGLRIGEFGARILPATGKLIADAMQKGVFKVRDNPDSRYIQDYDEILPSNIKGTGIFSEFLQNITPTTLEKKVGLDKLIKAEEKKQIDRGSTAGPKVFADTIGLGAEVTAPIFPGLKLLNSFAKARNLPVDNVTQKLLVKEIDEVLEKQGMNRREFLQATGASATVILAKMLGFGDEMAQTAKVAEKAAEVSSGAAPTYFFDLVEIIKRKGLDVTKKEATQNLQNVYSYKGYDLYEDLATGEIRIEKTNTGAFRSGDDVEEGIRSQDVMEYKPGRGDETTQGTPPDEYEQGSIFPDIDGKLKEVEELDVEKLLKFIKNEKID